MLGGAVSIVRQQDGTIKQVHVNRLGLDQRMCMITLREL